MFHQPENFAGRQGIQSSLFHFIRFFFSQTRQLLEFLCTMYLHEGGTRLLVALEKRPCIHRLHTDLDTEILRFVEMTKLELAVRCKGRLYPCEADEILIYMMPRNQIDWSFARCNS